MDGRLMRRGKRDQQPTETTTEREEAGGFLQAWRAWRGPWRDFGSEASNQTRARQRVKRREDSYGRGGLGADLGGDKRGEASKQRGARRREKRREDIYMRRGPGEDFGID